MLTIRSCKAVWATILEGLMVVLALGTAACGGNRGISACITGQSLVCACSGGALGTQLCQADHSYAGCTCSGARSCVQDASVTCACANGLAGVQACKGDQTFGTCVCGGNSIMTVDCVPGMSISCACTDGTAAEQTCSSDHKYDPCKCRDGADGGATDGDSGDGGDGGNGGGVIVETVLDVPDPTDGGTVTAHVGHGRFWDAPALFSAISFGMLMSHPAHRATWFQTGMALATNYCGKRRHHRMDRN